MGKELDAVDLLVSRTENLPASAMTDLRRLVFSAFGARFSEHDWQHALGGWHLVARQGTTFVSHAAVVPREVHVGGSPIEAGYVEAVATEPSWRGAGYATQVMHEVDTLLRREFQLGVLSSSAHRFYERLGWVRWQGPTYVRSSGAQVRTPEEDGGVMALRYGSTASLDLTLPIACEDRPGDAW